MSTHQPSLPEPCEAQAKNDLIKNDALGFHLDSDFPRRWSAFARKAPYSPIDGDALHNKARPAQALRFDHAIAMVRGRYDLLALQGSRHFHGATRLGGAQSALG